MNRVVGCLILPLWMIEGLAACAPAVEQSPTAAVETVTRPTVEPTPSAPAPTPTRKVSTPARLELERSLSAQEEAIVKELNAEGRELLTQAQSDLAERLNVAPEKITIVEAESVMWPDSSLGCPQPGMMYAQVITPGYRFVLEHDNQQYDYHAGNGVVVLCEQEEGAGEK